MMLDMRRTFDEMVQAHADARAGPRRSSPTPSTRPSPRRSPARRSTWRWRSWASSRPTGEWDLIVVDTPPSRSALDFLDAPQRMSNVPRRPDDPAAVLARPGRRRGLRKIVGAGFTLFAKAVSTILGGQMLADASAFVQAFDTMFGGFRERADGHLRAAALARHRVPRGRRAGAGRAARGGVLRRPALRRGRCRSPGWCSTAPTRCWPTLSATRARAAADGLRGRAAGRGGAAAARRPGRSRRPRGAAARPVHQRAPDVPVTRVPVVAGDVADLDGLREIGTRLRGRRWRPASALARSDRCAAASRRSAEPRLAQPRIVGLGPARAAPAGCVGRRRRRPTRSARSRASASRSPRTGRPAGSAAAPAAPARSSRPRRRTRCAGRARARGTRCGPGRRGRTCAPPAARRPSRTDPRRRPCGTAPQPASSTASSAMLPLLVTSTNQCSRPAQTDSGSLGSTGTGQKYSTRGGPG